MAAFFLCGPSQNVIARSELPQAVNDEAISPLVCHAEPAKHLFAVYRFSSLFVYRWFPWALAVENWVLNIPPAILRLRSGRASRGERRNLLTLASLRPRQGGGSNPPISMSRFLFCHSDPALAGEASPALFIGLSVYRFSSLFVYWWLPWTLAVENWIMSIS